MLIRIVVPLILSFSLLAKGQEVSCDPDLPPCPQTRDIGFIECNNEGCSIESLDLNYLVDGLKEMDEFICASKCKEQSKHGDVHNNGDTAKCRYFRYDKAIDPNDYTKVDTSCSLQTTCSPLDAACGESKNKPCVTGDINCFPDVSCNLKSATQYDSTKFHLVCLDKYTEVNIYDEAIAGKEIAVGTTCRTSRKCAAWNEANDDSLYSNELAITCSPDGTWIAVENTGNTGLSASMFNESTEMIKEPDCSTKNDPCPDLQLPEANQLALMCENPLVNNVLTGQNNCILLCDNSLKMTIQCGLSDEGKKAWLNDWGEVVKADQLNCQ